jgi:hypothetical protein
LLAPAIVALACAAPAAAVAGAAVAGAPAPPDFSFRPLQDGARAGRRLIDVPSRWTLGLGAAAALAARAEDDAARSYMRGRMGDWDRLGNDVLGTGVPGALLGAGFWLYGAWRDDAGAARSGQSQLEALAATGIATLALKLSVARARPDGSDQQSFPSGHTSTTFATAAVLNEFYGWRAGVPAYALAALTGASRLSADKHWLSDVAAGAALGMWMGRAFALGSPGDQCRAGEPARLCGAQSSAEAKTLAFWLAPAGDGLMAQFAAQVE